MLNLMVSTLVKHLEFEDILNSWLYCLTNLLELGTRTADDVKANTCPKFKRISETI